MSIEPLMKKGRTGVVEGMEDQAEPIVLSTRIRLARNLAGYSFPGWADDAEREAILQDSVSATRDLEALKGGMWLKMSDLTKLEKQVLVERHLISRELSEAKVGAAVIVAPDHRFAIMVNEEDHLRIQTVRPGLQFEEAWEDISQLDSSIEDHLDYTFAEDLGYLTACPTNLGTGLRASAMLHLPGLVMQEHMEKVIRMVNQLGMAVRGLFGEGSEATGSVFQISNQQTLGESEADILKRLNNVMSAIIEQEQNARRVVLEQNADKLFDRIGRAYGILRNAHLVSSDEAMNLLSLIRLSVDLEMLPEDYRRVVDRLFIESQPGHIQLTAKTEVAPRDRDRQRARNLRAAFGDFPSLAFEGVARPHE